MVKVGCRRENKDTCECAYELVDTPPFGPDVCTSVFESDVCGHVAVHVCESENEETFFEHF